MCLTDGEWNLWLELGASAGMSLLSFLHMLESPREYSVSEKEDTSNMGIILGAFASMCCCMWASIHFYQSIQEAYAGGTSSGKGNSRLFFFFFGRALKQSLKNPNPSIITRLYLENSMCDVSRRLGKEEKSSYSAQDKYSISKCFAASLCSRVFCLLCCF